jgi:para-nitrobenzyl esterase
VLAGQPSGLQTTSPVIDGVVLPMAFRTAFDTGTFNRVPVIEGSNRNEMTLFVAGLFDLQGNPVTEANYTASITALIGVPEPGASLLAARYPVEDYPTPAEALSALATDAAFACNALAADRRLAKWVPTYAYEFADPNAPMLYLPPVSFPYGAAHASEIQYLFDTPAAFPQPLDAGQVELSNTMIRHWTRFARAGKPGAARTIKWPRYDVSAAHQALMLSLLPPAPVLASAGTFSSDHACTFWDPLLGND